MIARRQREIYMRVKDKQTETERNLGNTQKIQNKFYKTMTTEMILFKQTQICYYLKM